MAQVFTVPNIYLQQVVTSVEHCKLLESCCYVFYMALTFKIDSAVNTKNYNMKIAFNAFLLAAYIVGAVHAQARVNCTDIGNGPNCMSNCGCGCTQPPLPADLDCTGGSTCKNWDNCYDICECIT